jgi:hypothetical protein
LARQGLSKARQSRTRTRQGKAWQSKVGQGKARQDKEKGKENEGVIHTKGRGGKKILFLLTLILFLSSTRRRSLN